jgi:hypothetical protein
MGGHLDLPALATTEARSALRATQGRCRLVSLTGEPRAGPVLGSDRRRGGVGPVPVGRFLDRVSNGLAAS